MKRLLDTNICVAILNRDERVRPHLSRHPPAWLSRVRPSIAGQMSADSIQATSGRRNSRGSLPSSKATSTKSSAYSGEAEVRSQAFMVITPAWASRCWSARSTRAESPGARRDTDLRSGRGSPRDTLKAQDWHPSGAGGLEARRMVVRENEADGLGLAETGDFAGTTTTSSLRFSGAAPRLNAKIEPSPCRSTGRGFCLTCTPRE